MNWSAAFYWVQSSLTDKYGSPEATAIAHMLLEHISKWSKLERLMQKDQLLSDAQLTQLQESVEQLLEYVPIQYIIGEAWFLERKFSVNPSVLIPRPETEELVMWVVQDYSGQQAHILDIGTGSGCIPISLKLELPESTVSACDISAAALATAGMNAQNLNAAIDFFEVNILDAAVRGELPVVDCIVSNPPYIPVAEANTMESHVREHEPHLALFVADNDPLLFYREIGLFGLKHLNPGGKIYFETHRDYMQETLVLLESLGYRNVHPRKDMHDNWRMLRAERP